MLSLTLTAALLFSFAACHKKDEVVMTIGDTQIPSGLYLALQYAAYSEFMGDIQETLEDSSAVKSYSDYKTYTHPDDGSTLVDWVNARTKELCLQYAALEKLSAENGISLTVDDQSYIDNYAKYYWENSIQMLYENNGVSYETYKKSVTFNYQLNKLFNFYYDEPDETLPGSGSKAVSKEEVGAQINKDYILADSLSISLAATYDEDGNAAEYSEEEKAAFKSKLDAYASRINSGRNTFAEIKAEYDAEKGNDSSSSTSSTASSQTTSIYPSTAAIYTATDTDSTNYDLYRAVADASGFEFSKAYVTGGNDSGSYQLVVLYDISKDDYYVDQYRSGALNTLKYDEFEAFLAEQASSYSCSEDSGLISYYNPDKVDFDKAVSKAAAR